MGHPAMRRGSLDRPRILQPVANISSPKVLIEIYRNRPDIDKVKYTAEDYLSVDLLRSINSASGVLSKQFTDTCFWLIRYELSTVHKDYVDSDGKILDGYTPDVEELTAFYPVPCRLTTLNRTFMDACYQARIHSPNVLVEGHLTVIPLNLSDIEEAYNNGRITADAFHADKAKLFNINYVNVQ